MDVTGTLEVDGHPQAGVAIALVADDGRTAAVTESNADGRFTLPSSAAPAVGWVVAKLHAPVGAVAAPITADRASIALAASSTAAVTLTIDVDLPPGAAPVSWFDVTVTPTSQDGVPAPALRTLTLDGMGPARSNAYHKVRIASTQSRLRVMPGTYNVHVSHVVEDSKGVPPLPPNWVSDKATLQDGRVVAADLESLAVEVRGDLSVRIAMAARK